LELALDNNPLSVFAGIGFLKKIEYAKSILLTVEKLKVFDGKPVEHWKEEIAKEQIELIPRSETSKRKSYISQTGSKTSNITKKTPPTNSTGLEIQGRQ
jgi:hypothetical protein